MKKDWPQRDAKDSKKQTEKTGLHPRNRFNTRYDFPLLIACSPALAAFVKPNAYGDDSIDYADPLAVKSLNQALLKQAYGLEHWDIPPGYLCPPIPGRSDYIHHLADLISMRRGASVDISFVTSHFTPGMSKPSLVRAAMAMVVTMHEAKEAVVRSVGENARPRPWLSFGASVSRMLPEGSCVAVQWSSP